MARLFALLADGKAVNAKADSAMLDILAHIDNEAHVMMARMGDAIVRAWPRRPAPAAAP